MRLTNSTPVLLATSLLSAFLLFLHTPLATAETAKPSQSSAISSLLAAYTHSLLTGPAATSIALEVELLGSVPASALPSIAHGLPSLLPSLTSGEDLYAFATAPPLAFTEPAWVQSLPGRVRSDVEALRTSVVVAEASIVASVLGVKQAVVTAATTTAAGPTNAAVGREGVGAFGLAGIVGFVAGSVGLVVVL